MPRIFAGPKAGMRMRSETIRSRKLKKKLLTGNTPVSFSMKCSEETIPGEMANMLEGAFDSLVEMFFITDLVYEF